jgi:uncharacterized protein (TIGR02646 family)
MKQIVKLPPPKSFVEYCAQPSAIYDGSGFPKDELRHNLLSEQGYICCYCMKRLPEKNNPHMKVEHFKCQDHYVNLQLAYSNLLIACTGNEGYPKKMQTCDTKKGDQELGIDLLTNAPNCETLFKYNSEGEISSATDNAEINRQLNDVLNLNMQTLKECRSQVYLEVQRNVESASKRLGDKQLKAKYFRQQKEKWLGSVGGKFEPFCMVAVYYITKKIRQSQNQVTNL